MIILDFSNILVAALFADGQPDSSLIDEDFLRHLVLNKIRSIVSKNRKLGEVIIACDKGSWRKGVYPYYKANRTTAKEKSPLNWTEVFEISGRLQDDLRQNFPYRVIAVQNAEADDVIGVLCREFGAADDFGLRFTDHEDILIISRDKDFGQLQVYSNVKQYDPITHTLITHPNPHQHLRELIIRGDTGDGIPNIMSDDDTLVVEGKRQKRMTAGRFEAFMQEVPPEFSQGFERNELLIDLKNTPKTLQEEIMRVYEAEAGKDRSRIFNYFVNNGLRNLMSSIADF